MILFLFLLLFCSLPAHAVSVTDGSITITNARTISVANGTVSGVQANGYALITIANTDAQTLSFSNPNLSIGNGNSVDISAIDTNTNANTICAGTTTYLDGEGNCDDIGTNTGDVTLAGTPDYITIAGQTITRGTVDISDDTNLTAGTNITLTGDDLSVDDVFVLTAGDTMTGELIGVDIQVTETLYADGVVDDGNSSTADTIDWGTGNHHKSTLTGNVTYTFTAPPGPATLTLQLVQDATGSRTATWPATVKWPGGTAPTLTTTAAAKDILSCLYDGTNYNCQVGNDFK